MYVCVNRCQVLSLEIISESLFSGLYSAFSFSMSTADTVTPEQDNELTLFLEAVKEANRRDDSKHLESEVEALKSQLMKLSKKLNNSLLKLRKQEEIVEKANKDKIQLKKELIESNYEKKQFELQFKNCQEDVQTLRNELKAKGSLILAIEKERRKLESDLSRNLRDLSRSDQTDTRSRNRSVSADRLTDQRNRLGKQLLRGGQAAAYTISKADQDTVSELDNEKLILLQKLLLQKTRSLAERDVTIEDLNHRVRDLDVQVCRLKKTRYLADELTECRHQLALKTNQLEAVRSQLSKRKVELIQTKAEVAKMRGRLNEFYIEKHNLLPPGLRDAD